MKKLLILLLVGATSCTSPQPAEQKKDGVANAQEKTLVTVPLNNGSKWNADETTKKNVAETAAIMNNNRYQGPGNRKQLAAAIETRLDTLISQCSMKGAAHDALHLWLEKVLRDVQELKEEHNEYTEAYNALKKDIESFHAVFD